ncbi:MAG TPA: YciI family protein [Arenicellales bacterium]|nr:YciI family protein [Arenicellales bacterium]
MRFMILVKASPQSERGEMAKQELFDEMAEYHEALAKAGVLVDGSGLQPSSKGWRITWKDGEKSITDGPFAETKELVAGYTLIETKTREEAEEWARRFPNPGVDGLNGEIEIRQLFELDDFEGVDVDRFREMEAKLRE